MPRNRRIPQPEYVLVDSQKMHEACRIYFHWKTLDAEIRTLSGSRGINLPSEITELIAAYIFGFYVNKYNAGDCVDLSNPHKRKVIEVKGSSADETSAPSSFSPKESYDELIYVRLEKTDDIMKLYRTGLSSVDIQQVKVNATQTLADQQRQGRRPRFSIQDKIVDAYGLQPNAIFNLQTREISSV